MPETVLEKPHAKDHCRFGNLRRPADICSLVAAQGLVPI